MKRNIAAMIVALPLVTGGYCLADNEVVPAPDSKAAVIKGQTEIVTKRLSQFIGKSVYNQAGKSIGQVKDIVLDGGTNRITYVVVSYGGVLGMGDKLFAVPWRAMEFRSVEPDKVFLNISDDTLKNAPGFDQDKWPDMASATFRDEIDRYYRGSPASAENAAAREAEKKAEAVKPPEKPGPQEAGLLWCRRVSTVIGADVRNVANDNMGDIEDLVIDSKTGRIQYAVLSFGGLFGVGDKLFALPIAALKTKPDDTKFVLDVPKDRLKDAPGFNKKNWPDFADPQFQSTLDDYYTPGRDTKR